MPYTLPALPYPIDALEPYIDSVTMEIHHDKHHAAYVKNLNAALEHHPELQSKDLEGLLWHINSLPSDARVAIRNNGGGHLNHSLFWKIMGPEGGGSPRGQIADAIDASFKDFNTFKKQFSKAALDHFGSGWAWVVNQNGRLAIETTANQDSPLMDGKSPLFGLDVWEHAYYLRYQNRRTDYIDAWWHVVDWAAVNRVFERDAVTFAK
jgi:Fe-Mn family superoxide dismutase